MSRVNHDPITIQALTDDIERTLSSDQLRFSFLFRSHVQDFTVGAKFLEENRDDPVKVRFISRRLCELSREIRFASPYDDRLPPDLLNSLQKLFEIVAELIPGTDDELQSYRNNVSHRREELAMD